MAKNSQFCAIRAHFHFCPLLKTFFLPPPQKIDAGAAIGNIF